MGTYSISERTKAALIRAAGELVAERGLGLVSTRAIAAHAGENLGTIHYHFGGKEGLLKQMLRVACHSEEGPTLPEVIRSFEGHLSTVEQQVEAVRAVVAQFVRETFSPERPPWCAGVLYQMGQHEGPLRTFLHEQMLDPLLDAMRDMFLRIRPGLNDTEVYLVIYMVLSPIVFHADHRDTILDRLGSPMLPGEYLTRFEQRLLDDTLRALGLPTDTITTEPGSAQAGSVAEDESGASLSSNDYL